MTGWDTYMTNYAALPESSQSPFETMTVTSVSPLKVRQRDGTRDLLATNAVTNWQHAVADVVLVVLIGGTLTVVASLAPRPQIGTVTAVAAPNATVAALSRSWTLTVVGTMPIVGDKVAIMWGSEGGLIIGKANSASAPPGGTVPDLPSTGGSVQTATFRPVASGSYRSGSLRGDTTSVTQGHWTGANPADNTGVVTYGDVWGAIRGKTIDKAVLTVNRQAGAGINGAVPVYLRIHAATALPSATPALLADSNQALSLVAGATGQVDATALVARFATGDAAGFAVSYAGTAHYAQFTGAGPSDSFALTVTYR